MELLQNFALTIILSVFYFSIFWGFSTRTKKLWHADLAWATGFFVINIIILLINNNFGFRQSLILLLFFLWGLRLSIYLILKNYQKEDFRYQKLKDKWGNKTHKISFINIYLFQALLLATMLIPAIINSTNKDYSQLELLDLLGTVFWLAGYLIQSIADLQLYKFKSDPKNIGKILSKGLWKYSRHPNYLGEIIMWIGVAIIVLNVPYGYLSIISPILISFLLIKVSGTNLVEKHLKTNPTYKEYIIKTPSIFPYRYFKQIINSATEFIKN